MTFSLNIKYNNGTADVVVTGLTWETVRYIIGYQIKNNSGIIADIQMYKEA